MKLFESGISLEEAERVVEAHRAAEAAKQAQALRRFLGRYFRSKEDLSFSLSIGRGEAWSYAMPTDVSTRSYPSLSGLVFVRTEGFVWVERRGNLGIERGDWIEVEAEEFWGAAKLAQSEVTAFLTRPDAKAAS